MRFLRAALFALLLTSPAAAQQSTVTAGAYAIGRGPGVSGYTSLLCSAGQLAVGQAGAPICRTVSGDWTLNAAGVATLATVNTNTGTWGSNVLCAAFNVNGKGLITAAAQSTCTPAVGSITGLGTGVATALAINVGSAGAPVVFNGALGTPSSGVATNITALNATQLTTGTIPAARTNGHQNGTATNDAAAAGEIGEFITSQLLIASATSVTTATAKDITTISLTTGDWDVWGVVIHIPAGTTVSQQLCAYVSSGSANTYAGNDSGQVGCLAFGVGATGGSNNYAITPVARFSLSSTTTLRLGVLDTFTTNTMTAAGTINARRRR